MGRTLVGMPAVSGFHSAVIGQIFEGSDADLRFPEDSPDLSTEVLLDYCIRSPGSPHTPKRFIMLRESYGCTKS